jgi:hypothetical protein
VPLADNRFSNAPTTEGTSVATVHTPTRLRSRYAYAAAFLTLGALLFSTSRNSTNWILMVALCWMSLDLWLVGLAYVLRWNTVFGKTAAGSMDTARAALMMPYLALTWGVWRLQHWLARDPIWNEISSGIFVGRRCHLGQLPSDTSTVIDFTAEFPGDKQSRIALKWLSIPVLDGCAPDSTSYEKTFKFLDGPRPTGIYLCCANGHGRSATFACALLLKLGLAATEDEAIAIVSQRRPGASLNREQRRSVSQFKA